MCSCLLTVSCKLCQPHHQPFVHVSFIAIHGNCTQLLIAKPFCPTQNTSRRIFSLHREDFMHESSIDGSELVNVHCNEFMTANMYGHFTVVYSSTYMNWHTAWLNHLSTCVKTEQTTCISMAASCLDCITHHALQKMIWLYLWWAQMSWKVNQQ